MKLSAAQQKVLDTARKEIQEAREATGLDDWYTRYCKYYSHNYTLNKLEEDCPENFKLVVDAYNKRLNGIVLTQASGPTIRKLESLGLIKILNDTTGTGSYRFDTIRVL